MVPKAGEPKLPFGSLKGGVFDMLKTSARNSKLARSVMRNVFPNIRSAFCKPGPRTGFRELLPIANCGASTKAAALNHCEALRFAKALGSLTRFGRCVPYPRLELELVAWETATVSPACTRTKPAISQPVIFHKRGI